MTAATRDLSGEDVQKAYGHWAGIYDRLCGPVFRPGHRAAARAANSVGTDILEVGVGTGLILPLYGPHTRVTGIDLSDEMLGRARRRVAGLGLSHVARLEAADIHHLDHAAARYDAIVFPFVLTLLEAPETALSNALRLLAPGGEIIIVSHLRSANGLFAAMESRAAPMLARWGLRPDFPLGRIVDWASGAGARVVAVKPVGPFGVYTLVRLGRA